MKSNNSKSKTSSSDKDESIHDHFIPKISILIVGFIYNWLGLELSLKSKTQQVEHQVIIMIKSLIKMIYT